MEAQEPEPEADFCYRTGVVNGRFYPFHHGHEFLIREALRLAETVYVFVSARQTQSIDAETRATWIKRIISSPRMVVSIIDQTEEGLPDDDPALWAACIHKHLGFYPDAIITSEENQAEYACLLKARHHLVDPSRSKVPISGTQLRSRNGPGLENHVHPIVYEAIKGLELQDDKTLSGQGSFMAR